MRAREIVCLCVCVGGSVRRACGCVCGAQSIEGAAFHTIRHHSPRLSLITAEMILFVFLCLCRKTRGCTWEWRVSLAPWRTTWINKHLQVTFGARTETEMLKKKLKKRFVSQVTPYIPHNKDNVSLNITSSQLNPDLDLWSVWLSDTSPLLCHFPSLTRGNNPTWHLFN